MAQRSGTMPNALSKAIYFREIAEQCANLADRAIHEQLRSHYSKLAENYLAVARAELARAEQERAREPSRA